jgi:hypothetical protein
MLVDDEFAGAATLDAAKIGGLELQHPTEGRLLPRQANRVAFDRHGRPRVAWELPHDLQALSFGSGNSILDSRPVKLRKRLFRRTAHDCSLCLPLAHR